MTPWREPAAETTDYPGLWVHDGRVSGSITLDRTRLPAWAVVPQSVVEDWSVVCDEYDVPPGWADANRIVGFLLDVLELRGEFARLVCVLADGERRERESTDGDDLPPPWWEDTEQRARVADMLRRCLATVDGDE